MQPEYIEQLQKVFEVQQKIGDIHPFLQKVFPIAIVSDGRLSIYDNQPSGPLYALVQQEAFPMPIPQGTRAAFPLESYHNRMACVVTPDVFGTPAGYVTIFHEFVHCQQFETCEGKIKASLAVARKAQAAKDYMWEIEYPFPYQAADFTCSYALLLEKHDLADALEEHRRLKAMLGVEDYEYMVWQEWKEGFARFIENQINQRLGLPLNQGGREPPYGRVTFYAGGAHLIRLITGQDPSLSREIEKLFDRLFNNG